MKKILQLIIIGLLFSTLTACKNNTPEKDTNKNEFLSLVEGSWVADGTQYLYILEIDGDKIIPNQNDFPPYYLNFDGEGKYTLQLKDYTQTGIYTVDDYKEVILKSDEGFISEFCKLENENKLHCNRYASLFIKE